MPRIYVDFSGILQIEKDCKTVSTRVSDIKFDFKRTIRYLDWDVKYQSDINKTASQLTKKLDSYEAALKSYKNFMGDVYKQYRKLDHDKFDENILDIESIAGDIAGNSNSEDEIDKRISSIIKSILKWKDKTKSDNTAGITKDGLSYLESLYKFIHGDMSGLTAADNWCDLCSNSMGLWKGFYGYLKKFYNETGNIFSIANQKKVAGLGIFAGFVGWGGDIFGAVDTIKNTENMGIAGKMGKIIGTGDNAVNIWEGIENLRHVGDKTSSGIYSPLSLYATIAKGYISAFSQGLSSFEEHSADGKWDMGDTAATGVESSVEGLYSMISSLTFGLVSEGTTGISADDVSHTLENVEDDIGTRAGEYIMSDPDLHQRYKEANTAGKVLLTFYAAIRG